MGKGEKKKKKNNPSRRRARVAMMLARNFGDFRYLRCGERVERGGTGRDGCSSKEMAQTWITSELWHPGRSGKLHAGRIVP